MMKGKMGLYEKVLVYGFLVASILLFVFAMRGAFAYTDPANCTAASLSDMRVNPSQTVTWTPGPFLDGAGDPVGTGNSSLSFDGVNQYVTVADSVELRLEGAHSIFVWVKLDSYVGTNNHVVRKATATNGFMLRLKNTGRLDVQILNGGNVGGATSSSAIYTLGEWACVGYTMDVSKNIILYYNGLPVGSGSATAFPGATAGTVMGIAANSIGTELINGTLDELHIYSRTLSPTEAAQHNQGIYLDETGLVLYLDFDGEALDQSGNGNDGALQNGPTYTDGWASVPVSTYYNGTISVDSRRILVNSTTGEPLSTVPDTAPTGVGVYNATLAPDNPIQNGTITGFIVDRFEVTLDAQYEETEAGFSTLLTAKGASAVDGHILGSGDSFTINGVAFTWNTYTSNFTGTVSKSTPQTATFGTTITGSEATYGITNFSVNNTAVVTWTTSSISRLQTGFGTGDWVGTIINEYVATAGGLATYTFIIGMISIAVYNISGVYATLFIWVLGWGTWSAVVHGEAQWLGIAFLCLGLGLAIVKMFMDRRTT